MLGRLASVGCIVVLVAASAEAQTSTLFDLASSGAPAAVQEAVNKGADVKAQDRNGATPLMWAAGYNQNAAATTTLLAAGADLKARDKDGETAMMYAAWVNPNPDVTAALVKAGADIKAQDKNGLNPLMQAARYNQNIDVLTTLLHAGADDTARNKEGKTTFDYAQENEKLKGSDSLKNLEAAVVAEHMARSGSPDELQRAFQELKEFDVKGEDPAGSLWLLESATANANAGVTLLILKAGANANARSATGLTALMAAASTNPNPDVLAALLRAGADPNAKDSNGDTPLILSGLNRNPDVATVLLKAGADFKAKDTNGKTALDLVTSRGNTATYQLLVAAEQPTWLGLHSLEMKLVSLDDIYPVFHTFYATHSLGKITLENTSGLPITGIKVDFQIRQFMTDPTDCRAAPELAPGHTLSVDLFGLFLTTILATTEKTAAQARVDLEFVINGQVQYRSIVQNIPILNRNATSWSDNQRAAAFVTTRDPMILDFSKNVNSMVRGKVQGDANLLSAVSLFQALQLYGLTYSQDPIPTLTSAGQVADFIQLPRATLQYKGGKCGDFSVLYAALFESVGVETAFITIPGHIFVAFSTGMTPDDARVSYSSRAAELIVRNNTGWIPVEVTETAGFFQAWLDGAKEWRDGTARQQAAFYPLHDAWQVYEPVALPGGDTVVHLPSADMIIGATQKELAAFVDGEISSKVTKLRVEVAGSKDPRVPTNELGVLYARYGLYDRAQEQFTKLLAGEEYVPALLNMGNIFYLGNKKDQALTYYTRAYAQDPGNPDVLLAAARTNYDLENLTVSRKLSAELSAKDPTLAKQFTYLGPGGGTSTRADNAAAAAEVPPLPLVSNG